MHKHRYSFPVVDPTYGVEFTEVYTCIVGRKEAEEFEKLEIFPILCKAWGNLRGFHDRLPMLPKIIGMSYQNKYSDPKVVQAKVELKFCAEGWVMTWTEINGKELCNYAGSAILPDVNGLGLEIKVAMIDWMKVHAKKEEVCHAV